MMKQIFGRHTFKLNKRQLFFFFWEQNLKNNNTVFKHESIVELVKKHKKGINIFPKNIDIVTGGIPCQDFSVSGWRKGFDSHK